MAFELRVYQDTINNSVYGGWNDKYKNILMVLPTGAGKTVCLSAVVKNESGAVCVIAHRQELVSQLSMSLAKNGIVHRVIAPKKISIIFCFSCVSFIPTYTKKLHLKHSFILLFFYMHKLNF